MRERPVHNERALRGMTTGLKLNEQAGGVNLRRLSLLFPCSCLLHLSRSSGFCLEVFQKSYIYCHIFCSSVTLILSLHSQTLLSSFGLPLLLILHLLLFQFPSFSPCLVHTVCILGVLLISFGIGKPNHPFFFHTIFRFFSLSSPT